MALGTDVFLNDVGNPTEPGYCEVAVLGHVTDDLGVDRPANNIYHLQRITLVGAIPTAGSVATSFFNTGSSIKTNQMAALSDQFTLDDVTGRFMDDPTTPAISAGITDTGDITGQRGALFDAVTIRLLTAGRGKRFRSNKHFSPLAESSYNGDSLTVGGVTVFAQLRDTINAKLSFNDANGNSWRVVMLSPYYSDFQANPSVFGGAKVTLAQLNETITTMRRRRQKNVVVSP